MSIRSSTILAASSSVFSGGTDLVTSYTVSLYRDSADGTDSKYQSWVEKVDCQWEVERFVALGQFGATGHELVFGFECSIIGLIHLLVGWQKACGSLINCLIAVEYPKWHDLVDGKARLSLDSNSAIPVATIWRKIVKSNYMVEPWATAASGVEKRVLSSQHKLSSSWYRHMFLFSCFDPCLWFNHGCQTGADESNRPLKTTKIKLGIKPAPSADSRISKRQSRAG